MKRKFKLLSNQQPYLSPLMVFNSMIRGGDITSKAEINKWFEKLVPRIDYPVATMIDEETLKEKVVDLRDDVLNHCYSLL